MLTAVYSPDFKLPHPRVQAKLYDAVECMRLADDLLQVVIDKYKENKRNEDTLPEIDFWEAQSSMRLHANILQEIMGGDCSISAKTFKIIRGHKNHSNRNSFGTEAAMLALMLAHDSLDEAMDLSRELEGEEIEDDYRLMLAAHGAANLYKGLIESTMVSFFHDEALEFALKGQPIPSYKEMRRTCINETYPEGNYPNGKPVWDQENDEPLYADS